MSWVRRNEPLQNWKRIEKPNAYWPELMYLLMWFDILWLDTKLKANLPLLHERCQIEVYGICQDSLVSDLVLESHGATKGSPFGSTTVQRKVCICARTLSLKMDAHVVQIAMTWKSSNTTRCLHMFKKYLKCSRCFSKCTYSLKAHLGYTEMVCV